MTSLSSQTSVGVWPRTPCVLVQKLLSQQFCRRACVSLGSARRNAKTVRLALLRGSRFTAPA
jgi:hypothetical protein